MDPIRSSGHDRSAPKPPPPPAPPVDEYDEEMDIFWSFAPPELADEEADLPEPVGLLTYHEDRYEDLAWRNRVDGSDPPAAWEPTVEQSCGRCGEPDDIDPMGTCWTCRLNDSRCQWCGLDQLVYVEQGSCRTCYRQIQRVWGTRVTSEDQLRIVLMEAAFRRSDLRKRRQRAD